MYIYTYKLYIIYQIIYSNFHVVISGAVKNHPPCFVNDNNPVMRLRRDGFQAGSRYP